MTSWLIRVGVPGDQLGVHMGDLSVRLAELDDVEPVIDLLAEAGHWVRAVTGVSQWPERFPREFMIDLVDRGALYVAHGGSVLAATLCLQWADPTFWPGADDDAVYVHRLAVKRSYAGSGERLLDWAAERAVETGRAFVRVDCITENAGLRRYYESLGFRHRGDVSGENPPPFNVTFHSRWYASQYEKPVAFLPRPQSP
jgi:GNAT superfamily N-acetyltransferase